MHQGRTQAPLLRQLRWGAAPGVFFVVGAERVRDGV